MVKKWNVTIPELSGDKKAMAYLSNKAQFNQETQKWELMGLDGNVAVKVSTGEKGSKGYLKADLIGPLVEKIGGTIVECNTAYNGERNKTDKHKKLLDKHGWTKYFKVDLSDL